MIGRRAQLAAGMALVVASFGGGPARRPSSPPASTPAVQAGALRITVLYDNTAADARLQEAWGFSALVEYRGHTLLMDAGADPLILRRNMDSLGIAPSRIEAIVLTHAAGDHAAGLKALVDSRLRRPLYVLGAFPQRFRVATRGKFALVDAAPRQELIPGVFTTGEMMDPAVNIPEHEQSLVIPTDSGLVIITGCAHPGVVSIVRRATEMFGGPVRLVLGGFHLIGKSTAEIRQIVSDFRGLGVRRVGATHCTGDPAIAQFAEAYGSDYVGTPLVTRSPPVPAASRPPRRGRSTPRGAPTRWPARTRRPACRAREDGDSPAGSSSRAPPLPS